MIKFIDSNKYSVLFVDGKNCQWPWERPREVICDKENQNWTEFALQPDNLDVPDIILMNVNINLTLIKLQVEWEIALFSKTIFISTTTKKKTPKTFHFSHVTVIYKNQIIRTFFFN